MKMSKSDFELAKEILLQPWFLPRRLVYKIRGIVPPDYWNKMRYVFDDYGCMVCGNETTYGGNGMCQRCMFKTRKKILASVKRRAAKRDPRRLDLDLFNQEKLAKKLLARYAPERHVIPRSWNVDIPGRNNPVYETLCTHGSTE